MAKDFINGKRTRFGNKRSHALNSSRVHGSQTCKKLRF